MKYKTDSIRITGKCHCVFPIEIRRKEQSEMLYCSRMSSNVRRNNRERLSPERVSELASY